MIILCITNGGTLVIIPGRFQRSNTRTDWFLKSVMPSISMRDALKFYCPDFLQEYRQVETAYENVFVIPYMNLGLGISQGSAIFRIDKAVTIQVTIDNISGFRINAF